MSDNEIIPDRIWAWPVADDWTCLCGSWDGIEDTMPPPQQAYIAATPAALAASPEVRAITARAVRLALERAVGVATGVSQACAHEAGKYPLQSRQHDDWMERDYGATLAKKAIRALLTDEAVDAIIKEASDG